MFRRVRSLLLLAAVAAAVSGCPKKPAKNADGGSGTGSGSASSPNGESPEVRTGLPAPEDAASLLARVHFALDSSTLDGASRDSLRRAAGILASDPSIRVRIEGHADERGTTQYNLALSERRATAVLRFLSDLGVERSRMTTAAYGEERPLDPGHDESAWSRNRRVEVLVSEKAGRFIGGR